uniref:Serine incorporator 5 n=1 Tax=Steinernema glaseri TaxID=37863 RepID=A0A1I8A5V2_9BILA
MGALLAAPACAASMACCFGSTACSLCCAACPSARSSTTTRVMYATMLFVGTFVACLMLAPGIQAKLADGNWFCAGLESMVQIKCNRATGFQAVYRLCAAMATFFFIFMALMWGVRSSNDVRAKIQNGFWFFKYLLLIGITVGFFYIRSENLADLLAADRNHRRILLYKKRELSRSPHVDWHDWRLRIHPDPTHPDR